MHYYIVAVNKCNNNDRYFWREALKFMPTVEEASKLSDYNFSMFMFNRIKANWFDTFRHVPHAFDVALSDDKHNILWR